MAAPATHIILAKIVKDKYFPHIDDKKYYIGTSFADIRYIANIDRNLTHFYDINSPSDITNTSPFMIGLKVHSFIDEKRVKFMRDHGLFELTPEGYLTSQITKVYEDMILYDEIEDWDNYVHFFKELLPDEKEFPIPEIALLKWHKIIEFCISNKPTDDSTVKFLNSKLQKKDNEKEIRDTLQTLRKNKKIKNLILAFYQEFKLTV